MKEFIIFVSTDSTEFFSKLRSAGLNYNLPSFSLTLTVRGVSNKHCLLFFFSFFQQVPLTKALVLQEVKKVLKASPVITQRLDILAELTSVDDLQGKSTLPLTLKAPPIICSRRQLKILRFFQK